MKNNGYNNGPYWHISWNTLLSPNIDVAEKNTKRLWIVFLCGFTMAFPLFFKRRMPVG